MPMHKDTDENEIQQIEIIWGTEEISTVQEYKEGSNSIVFSFLNVTVFVTFTLKSFCISETFYNTFFKHGLYFPHNFY